ncbi:MAG: transcription antitermination factor NusB [Alistipes indistinctus]
MTLDEFIEIAKYYSTPGSSTFINGILDKVVEALREGGRLQKAAAVCWINRISCK